MFCASTSPAAGGAHRWQKPGKGISSSRREFGGRMCWSGAAWLKKSGKLQLRGYIQCIQQQCCLSIRWLCVTPKTLHVVLYPQDPACHEISTKVSTVSDGICWLLFAWHVQTASAAVACGCWSASAGQKLSQCQLISQIRLAAMTADDSRIRSHTGT